ncbi:S8 family serine peptidase [Mesobacillus selenatarsenatis]|uniref:Uncharacterized protein n=1 Tax=Mesobacillus selenatarsenatis (strain DSM 18680 / JCM 14380 / FERM P-15431 / SF-1) TaxID=1321606 RepID=A0A0A8WWN3_MESS1|nr:S8 family serine peptidase [Mesobacillus selenatarsenatis]GAM12023.1 hypothetical protein SAMD00020551_0142 [Mesobacillus selenatarsenatis SF-1]
MKWNTKYAVFIVTLFILAFSFDSDHEVFAGEKFSKQSFKRLSSTKEITNNIHSRQILIKLKNRNVNLESLDLIEKESPTALDSRGIVLVEVPIHFSYQKMLDMLAQNPGIEYVEPNYLYEHLNVSDDPFYNYQWHIPVLNIHNAWGYIQNPHPVRVAVLDSGVDPHSDLAGKVLPGYDIPANTPFQTDLIGHGTNIAGIIAGIKNNGIGIAGINENVEILPVKITDQTTIQLTDVIEGIYYAIDNGAQIINMSYGSEEGNHMEYDALKEAYTKGITLIAATGNDYGAPVSFPAAYPFVIGVGSVDQEGKRSAFSNYGDSLDLVAPGEEIVSTGLREEYEFVNGTSFSAPIVSGIASMLLSQDPKLSPSEIEWKLENSTERSWTETKGFGQIDAVKALLMPNPSLHDDAGNSVSQARLIKVGHTYEESIQIPDDVDYYKFVNNEVSDLSFQTTSPASHDIKVTIKKVANGHIEWEEIVDNLGIGGIEKLSLRVNPGTYYIEISDFNYRWSKNQYKLKVSSNSYHRIEGSSRTQTAVNISRKGWPSGLTHQERAIILARADHPADALSAAGIAAMKDSPILLTFPEQIDTVTLREIFRLNPEKIYLLGGKNAIDESVETLLKNKGYTVQRVHGKDRFETSINIGRAAGLTNQNEAIIANGITVADALSASSISVSKHIPIYLSQKEKMPMQLPEAIKKVYILGGEAAISTQVESDLKRKRIEVVRIAGHSRYDTNINAIKKLTNPDTLILVRGTSAKTDYEDYPDAVAASGLAHRRNGAIVLVNPLKIENVTKSYVSSRSYPMYALGGEKALPGGQLTHLGLKIAK